MMNLNLLFAATKQEKKKAIIKATTSDSTEQVLE